jgi:hypothetical protein
MKPSPLISRHGSLASIALALLFAAPLSGQPSTRLRPIERVDYDARGVFRVNGKAFFPIALYDAPLDDKILHELGDFGFNLLTCPAKSAASLPGKGFYGLVHADKKIEDLSGVFMGMGVDSPALVFKKDLLTRVAAANAKTRAATPQRPIMNAIGYWLNEPTGVVQGLLPTKELYEDLVAAIDVSAPYLYPVPYQPVSSVGDAVARAVRATHGTKPVVPILQLFAWDAKDRYPSAAELRCMAFLALIEGARGIGYYSYGSVTGQPKMTIAMAQPELWRSVKKLNHDIADIGPRLLQGSATDDLTLDNRAVKIKCVREKAGILAVIINASAVPQEIMLTSRTRARGRLLLQDGKQIEIIAGVANVRLDPFAVEIARWPLD